MYTPKKSNHLRSHLRGIMALDHSRLGLKNKLLKFKQIRPNFLLSTSLLYKLLPTSLGTCKPTFYTFYTWHLRWNSTMKRCFYHTDLGQNAVSHNFATKLHSFNIQDDRSTRGLLARPLKKFPSWFSLFSSTKIDCLN